MTRTASLIFVLCGLCIPLSGKQIRPISVQEKDPLPGWNEHRYIECTFCLDYDDFRRMSIFGCRLKRIPSCRGNVCYMRQHKNDAYFLFTSGCLNMTQIQYNQLKYITSNVSPSRETTNSGQLCEVTTMNTCICSDRHDCNNVSNNDSFIEYTEPIFRDTNFNEMSHFKYFLPNDPILENIVAQSNRDEYFLIKSIQNSNGSSKSCFSESILVLLFAFIFLRAY